MKILCPHCNQMIEVEISTYYSRHKERILQAYKDNTQDPEFRARKREIALKSYHKRKQCRKK